MGVVKIASSSHLAATPRNLGIKWVLEQGQEDGVLYFADDDNTYDLRLFRSGMCLFGHTRTIAVSTYYLDLNMNLIN